MFVVGPTGSCTIWDSTCVDTYAASHAPDAIMQVRAVATSAAAPKRGRRRRNA